MMELLYSYSIRGTFKIDYPWYISAFKLSDDGLLKIFNSTIELRIGAKNYRIQKIYNVSTIPITWRNWEQWIEITTNNQYFNKVYIREYSGIGIRNGINGGTINILKALKEYVNKHK